MKSGTRWLSLLPHPYVGTGVTACKCDSGPSPSTLSRSASLRSLTSSLLAVLLEFQPACSVHHSACRSAIDSASFFAIRCSFGMRSGMTPPAAVYLRTPLALRSELFSRQSWAGLEPFHRVLCLILRCLTRRAPLSRLGVSLLCRYSSASV